MATGRIDIPNARSSHSQPTPRGGGVAVAIVSLVGLGSLTAIRSVGLASALVWLVGGVLVAVVGHLDDRYGLSAFARFVVHLVASTLAATLVLYASGTAGFFPELPLAAALTVVLLGIAWSINLFNFMDGIDGIAASQAVFMSLATGMLIADANGDAFWVSVSVLTAGASLGFLVWNWPPAKIFMGDVGSGFLGYWLAVLAIGLHVSGNLSIWTSVILGSVFIADATTTLLRRVVRGERWYEAHRTHAYQHLAQRWGSHLKVTGLVWGINLGAILPLAYASTVWPQAAFWIAAAALGGLSLGCLALGAGKPSPT